MLPADFASTAVLSSFGFDDQLIADIQSFLGSSADDLESSVPQPVASRAFGGSPASVGCASDAGLARETVREALIDMVAGFHTWDTGLGKFRDDTHAVTTDVVSTLTTIQSGTECIDTPTLASPSQCTVPGSGG